MRGTRQDVADVMAFALDHAECAEEICKILKQSLTSSKPDPQVKIARLYAVSDILHNSSATVKNASAYRSFLQSVLPAAFESLRRCYKGLVGRLTTAGFKERVLRVLRVWDEWNLYPPLYLTGLEATFLVEFPASTTLGDVDESALDVEELRKRCRQSGVPDGGSAADLLARLHGVSEYARLRAEGVAAEDMANAIRPAGELVEEVGSEQAEGGAAVGATREGASESVAAGTVVAADGGEGAADACPVGERAGQSEDVDGVPLEDEDDDVDGVPLEDDDVDGVPLEDDGVDGVPLEGEDEDVDGVPLEEVLPPGGEEPRGESRHG